MYLVDTNVWLERLLDQENAGQVKAFLDRTPSETMFITDFSFHSIGVVTSRLKRLDILAQFIDDTFISGSVGLINLDPKETDQVMGRMEQFRLDFDDAYQYVAAEKYDLVLVSFDQDFDRTARGKKTPRQISPP